MEKTGDHLVPVWQGAEPGVEGCDLGGEAEPGEVAGVHQDVAVGDGELNGVVHAVGVADANHLDHPPPRAAAGVQGHPTARVGKGLQWPHTEPSLHPLPLCRHLLLALQGRGGVEGPCLDPPQ